ncbi:MAG: hypothetical protein A3H69_05665, partial [Candidatus Sungbacteria bacterium RIFCSPLOWO2_02_FULL_47_9]
MNTFAFIDASNLFYGGEKSLGWKIDYQKLFEYLKQKYGVSKVFYFGGVEIHDFSYDYQKDETVPLKELENHLIQLLKNQGKQTERGGAFAFRPASSARSLLPQAEKFGYKLFLKPVKFYKQDDGGMKKKANCDVDLAFHLMKERDNFNRVIVLSGDGDFLPVL